MNGSVLSARRPQASRPPVLDTHFMMLTLASWLQASGALRHAPAFAPLDSI